MPARSYDERKHYATRGQGPLHRRGRPGASSERLVADHVQLLGQGVKAPDAVVAEVERREAAVKIGPPDTAEPEQPASPRG